MIDWSAFLAVAIASLVAALSLVFLFSLGLRLLPSADAPSRARRIAATTCFVLCGFGVLFGIYLIVPALHQA